MSRFWEEPTMGTTSEEIEEIGFDENETISDDDVVVLQAEDGSEVEHVLLAVIDLEQDSYAVLTPRALVDADEPGDLLVVRYLEDAQGVARFEPLEDASVIASLEEAMAHMVRLAPVEGLDES
jgi:hypothetical protein